MCKLFYKTHELKYTLPTKSLITVIDHLKKRGIKDLLTDNNFGSYETFAIPTYICRLCYTMCVNEFKLIEVF